MSPRNLTPARIEAAKLLKRLNDIDRLPTESDVLELALLDPDELRAEADQSTGSEGLGEGAGDTAPSGVLAEEPVGHLPVRPASMHGNPSKVRITLKADAQNNDYSRSVDYLPAKERFTGWFPSRS